MAPPPCRSCREHHVNDEMGEVFKLVTDPVQDDCKILELARVGFCVPRK